MRFMSFDGTRSKGLSWTAKSRAHTAFVYSGRPRSTGKEDPLSKGGSSRRKVLGKEGHRNLQELPRVILKF